MKNLLKEPLLHFLLIGGLIFLIYYALDDDSRQSDTILIDESDLSEIVIKFESQYQRNPTEEELMAILGKRIHDEVFYREALKMNLDHNDEIIKRRLAQKMQYLSNDLASIIEPTDEEVKAFFDANMESYLLSPRYSFYHIFFRPDLREDWYGDAEKILLKFPDISIEKMLLKGDEISISNYYDDQPKDYIERSLGQNFTTTLKELEMNKWSGPVKSGYGAHLVYITNKTEAQVPEFDLVKNDVLKDFNYQKEIEMNKSIYKEIRQNYDVELDIDSSSLSPDLLERLSVEITGF